MARRNRRTGQRRRRGRFGILYKLLSFLVIFTALLVGCVVFFRVNEVTVTGNSRYTVQEIIDASGVELGDNLLLVNKPQTARNINRVLPYVETVSPIRRLPDTLELRITETVAVARLETGDGWWLINSGGKLVELGAQAGEGLPQVFGLTPITPTLGARLTVEMAEQVKLEGLRSLLSALEKRGMLGGVTSFIDLSASNLIRFNYGDDLTVVVPMSGDFDRRARSLERVLETYQEQGEQVVGTLDLTYGDNEARVRSTERWIPEALRPTVPDPTPAPAETGEPDPVQTPAGEPSQPPGEGGGA